MNHRSLRIFIACAVGAVIGTTIAIALKPYLWWVGFLIGCPTAYLFYDLEKVGKAIKIAWKKVIGWKPDTEKWKLEFFRMIAFIFLAFGFLFSMIFQIIFSVYIITNLGRLLPSNYEYLLSLNTTSTSVPVVFIISLLILSFILFVGSILPSIKFWGDDIPDTCEDTKKLKKSILFLNPISMPFFCPIYTFFKIGPKILGFVKIYAPKILRSLGLFIKLVLIQIHSEERLLCLVGAGFGILTGLGINVFYNTDALYSIIIGAFVGGIIGVLDYEILSKRVLKLVPVKVRK